MERPKWEAGKEERGRICFSFSPGPHPSANHSQPAKAYMVRAQKAASNNQQEVCKPSGRREGREKEEGLLEEDRKKERRLFSKERRLFSILGRFDSGNL